jgi:hypothetical protein
MCKMACADLAIAFTPISANLSQAFASQRYR